MLLSFKRLNLADSCFKKAEALARYLDDLKPDTADLIYSPMVAGIVVTYMRPFVQSDGLGKLESDFEQFDDEDLTGMHNQLKESRHKLYAHQDFQAGTTLSTTDGSIPFEMEIEFEDITKGYTMAPGAVEIDPSNLTTIVRLCQHQKTRITRKINNLLPQLTGRKSYAAGRYTVGVNFP